MVRHAAPHGWKARPALEVEKAGQIFGCLGRGHELSHKNGELRTCWVAVIQRHLEKVLSHFQISRQDAGRRRRHGAHERGAREQKRAVARNGCLVFYYYLKPHYILLLVRLG